jgi:hypothetical protein
MLSNQRIQRFKANLFLFYYFNGVEINKLSIKKKGELKIKSSIIV